MTGFVGDPEYKSQSLSMSMSQFAGDPQSKSQSMSKSITGFAGDPQSNFQSMLETKSMSGSTGYPELQSDISLFAYFN